MNRAELLGSSFDCECHKQHHIPTETLIYSPDAYKQIPRFVYKLTEKGNCLIIADSRTWEAAGKKVYDILQDAGCETGKLIVPDKEGESPVTDDATRDYLLEHCPECDLFIAVGSGVINDLTKWVSFLREKPYICVPTAASMNGYASANVAASIDGLKVLFHAEACRGVFADPEVINNAPEQLIGAGLGDVLAKTVSASDWKMNRLIFNDYYCQFAVDLLKDLEPIYLNNPGGIRNRDPEALKALFEALFYSSAAMTMTGTSSVASGGEHLLSHTLDMTAGRDEVSHDLHGRQVGIGTILGAAVYDRIMEIEQPVFRDIPDRADESFWGSLTPIVAGEYEEKCKKIAQARTYLEIPGNWKKVKETLQAGLILPDRLKNCLKNAGAAHRYSDLLRGGAPLERDFFLKAVKNANQMRKRFTVLDLGVMLGIIPEQVEELVDQLLS